MHLALAASVESIVSKIEDIESVRVNLPLEKATIRWSEGANQDLDAVKTAIRNGGFGSKIILILENIDKNR